MNYLIFPRSVLGVATVLAALALAGCGGAERSTDAAPRSSTPAPISLDEADVLFVQMLIPHHQDAVTMAELAETRADDQDVLSVAEQIGRTQQPQIDTMIGWVQAAGQPTVPPDFDTGHGPGEHVVSGAMTFTDLVRLRESSGARFDRRFLLAMIRHHRGTLKAVTTESAHVSSPEVKALARDMVVNQKAELAAMRKILARD